jgi:dUTP pyrophosphatase
MLQVKFKKLHPDAKLPVKGSLDSACFDVYATSTARSGPGKITMGLGFATEIPKGWKGVIVPRSNLTKHNWVISNSPGQIDSDYRGEWKIVFSSTKEQSTFPYNIGERVAQIFFEKVEPIEFVEVEELDQTDRGAGGFGSTGINYVTNTTADVKTNIIS